jgi:hypothetical protein
MTHKRAIQARHKLLGRLPDASEILRGSLLQRAIRHSSGCPKCARGEGHPLWVLTVSYPGGRTRQCSLRREQVPQVRRWLNNYRKLKDKLEAICELNHHLLRPDSAAPESRSKGGPRRAGNSSTSVKVSSPRKWRISEKTG